MALNTHDLRPFRDYDEKDIINIFAYNETPDNVETTPIHKGTLVKIQTGWDVTQELGMLEAAGDNSVSNTVSQRYEVKAKVVATSAGNRCLGMTLFDVKEKDENGELLKYNPRKAAELQAVLAGQAVPIITRGIFLYEHDGDPSISANDLLYSGATGEITAATGGDNNIVGIALGDAKLVGSKYQTLIKLDCGANQVN